LRDTLPLARGLKNKRAIGAIGATRVIGGTWLWGLLGYEGYWAIRAIRAIGAIGL
jgi:hypothetical protein